jgi:S-formylglutathione hydrolase FrmB
MKKLMSALWVATAATTAAAEVQQTSFHSASLDRDVAVSIQLPPSYGRDAARRFPAVYALHGLFESQVFWERRGLSGALDGLWASGAVPEFVLVAVDGDNSFFVNGPEGRYEDLVTKDAPTWVEAHYRVLPGRSARGLWGVSMGGYAALRIAFAHPEAFAAVATHSAMLLEAAPTAGDGAGRWQMNAFHQAFGDPIDLKLWEASDPLALSARADPKNAPALYFDCGSEDRYGLFRGNAELDRRLTARRVPHTFSLHPGSHGYEYVHTVIDKSLTFLGKALAR